MTETVQISLQDAVSLLSQVFERSGASKGVATSVAHALVAAESEGQIGHGFSRVADYAAQLQSGKINPNADMVLTRNAPASLHVLADYGFAYPAIEAALATGLPLAREMGIAVMTIGNSHHCGALAIHVEKIAQAGLIGLMVANTPKAIAPWGAKDPVFGTNPIAFATPVKDAPPLVIDLSLSVVARGKVMAAKKAGKPIPTGWALDAQGQPTTDPEAALEGTMLPIGDAKGTTLALMIEVLASALTGSAFSAEAGSFFHANGPQPNVGQTIIAIDPGSRSDFGARVKTLLDQIAAMPGARLPGARRRAAIARSESDGLQVPAHLFDQVQRLANPDAQT